MPVELISGEEMVNIMLRKMDIFVVHFTAAWAPSCNGMDEALQAMLDEGLVKKAYSIDAEKSPSFALKYNITSVPTVLLFEGTTLTDRVEGFHPLLVRQMLSKHERPIEPTNAELRKETKDVRNRIKELLKSHKLMLFMKGEPEGPRCGFSRQIVALLNEHNLDYGSFDILNDEEIRQGLKEYSNWPTYPQLYLNGDLIGGLDVVKEELQDKRFIEMLPKKFV